MGLFTKTPASIKVSGGRCERFGRLIWNGAKYAGAAVVDRATSHMRGSNRTPRLARAFLLREEERPAGLDFVARDQDLGKGLAQPGLLAQVFLEHRFDRLRGIPLLHEAVERDDVAPERMKNLLPVIFIERDQLGWRRSAACSLQAPPVQSGQARECPPSMCPRSGRTTRRSGGLFVARSRRGSSPE